MLAERTEFKPRKFICSGGTEVQTTATKERSGSLIIIIFGKSNNG